MLFSIRRSISVLGISLISNFTWAQDNPLPSQIALAEQFPQCVALFQNQAKEKGMSTYLVEDVLGQVKSIPKVLEYDRRQPEFVQTFPDYLTKRVNSWRINKGRQMLSEHGDLLSELYQDYGIPPHYLLAFWGLETNFGQYKGKMPILNALATLACDQRRSKFFTEQLMLALELVEREQLNVDKMVGSWAGAMGHTQFMPSAYLTYAKDGDDDGKINLWDSVPDALTSAANFLHHLGWKPGLRWGREVSLPSAFDYAQSGKANKHPLSYWQTLGITQTNGEPVAAVDINSSLIIPSGYQGPAFLVYGNFDVILRWNNSEFYGLAVGYLADRIIGGDPLKKPLPKLPTYSIDNIRVLQTTLNQLGYDVGDADGIMGPATRKGIRDFQASKKIIADGFPSIETFMELKIPIS